MALYAVIAGSVIIENFFPPSPSDVFVVLAAFLSSRGQLDPWTIFLVAWGFGVFGAVVVYFSARYFGRRFLDSRLGKRMITPAGFASIEREYLRFGVLGIFISRMLPGFRAFVAPFAGFVSLPPAKALLPITLAAGTWYGGLTFLGSTMGAEWEAISGVLGRLNRTLAIVAGIVLAVLVVWIVRRKRQRAEESLWTAVHLAFRDDEDVSAEVERDPAIAGAAALLIELARHEHNLGEAELAAVRDRVHQRWGVTPRVLADTPPAEPLSPDRAAEVSRAVTSRYGLRARERIAERLRRVTRADALLSRFEARLMERADELLGLPTPGAADRTSPGPPE
jgi:membrane protein DedA with SNARE-associated domain